MDDIIAAWFPTISMDIISTDLNQTVRLVSLHTQFTYTVQQNKVDDIKSVDYSTTIHGCLLDIHRLCLNVSKACVLFKLARHGPFNKSIIHKLII